MIEMATVSERGQVAIPADIRREFGIEKGDKLVFITEGNNIRVKKVVPEDFLELTEPLREMKKKIEEEDVVDLVHEIRKRNSQDNG